MANFWTYSALDMTGLTLWSGQTTVSTEDELRVEARSKTAIYSGDFAYSDLGDVSGTLESFSELRNGEDFYSITGLDLDVGALMLMIGVAETPLEVFEFALFDNDFISGSNGDDLLLGFDGNDVIHGQAGFDLLFGNDGDDEIEGAGGTDALFGGRGRDMLFGGAETDALFGGAGNDRLVGGGGTDAMVGQGGSDVLKGGGGSDLLLGDGGNDKLIGGAAMDILIGGAGKDRMIGGGGSDVIVADRGDDVLKGGAGADVFVLTRNGDNDRIVDFSENDGLFISKFDLPSKMTAEQFALLYASADGNDTVITFGKTSVTLEGYGYDAEALAGQVRIGNPEKALSLDLFEQLEAMIVQLSMVEDQVGF